MKKRYLIVGSSGFIGSKLLALLNSSNKSINTINRSSQITSDNITEYICTLDQDELPKEAFKGVEVVVHLSGIAHDMTDASIMENTYRKLNIDWAIRVASVAVSYNVKKFIYLSSVKAGGKQTSDKCYTENDQYVPEGVYGKTKREAELKLLSIGDKSDMNVSIIRPSLVYGPGAKGNLQFMLSGIRMGWFPPLPKIKNKRSMIHVDDLVRAIMLVAEDDRSNGNIFIATDGNTHSSRDLYVAMCGVVGREVPGWTVPKVFFEIVALFSAKYRYKVGKLLGSECYSSEKLESLGFKARKDLRDMNETSI